MDSVIALSFLGILALVVVIALVLKSAEAQPNQTRSVSQKRAGLMNDYRQRLDEAMREANQKKKEAKSVKAQLLQKISEELAMNVLFDADEKREMIKELAAYEPQN